MEFYQAVQGVSSTDRFGSSGGTKNSFVLLSGSGVESGRPWAAKVLLLFRIGIRICNESPENVFFAVFKRDTSDEYGVSDCLVCLFEVQNW